MRVLYVLPNFRLSGDGRLVEQLARNLASEVEVRVCGLGRPHALLKDLQRESIECTALSRRVPLDPVALWRLRQLATTWRPNVIHVWGKDAATFVLLATSGWKVPVVVTQRSVEGRESMAGGRLIRRLARRCELLLATGACVRNDLVSRGTPSQRVQVVNACVGPTAARPRPGWFAERGISAEAKLIAVVASHVHRNCLDVALWGAEILGGVLPDLHLLVFGDGPLQGTAARPRRVDGTR